MNRSVLARQMFAKGGEAFPDLNKDGEITQADILMGRGVELKQAGGIAGMMPPEMPPPPAMPPTPPPMEGGQAIDPQVLEGALATAEQEITNLDEAEDFETVMNTIRGDEATVEERYEELASVVGEEDARQTPESVLTLVQPAMVMGAVDQGIGGLAQQEMMEPVQGAMAQGIMSTVEPPQPTGGMGGPPPVNFKEGGLVRRGDNQPVLKFQNAGVVPNLVTAADFRKAIGPSPSTGGFVNPPTYDERVLAAARGAEERYAAAGLGTAEERAAALEEQKNLTKAQMLFDIAQTALTFAGPMEKERRGASAAERLAMAASATKLPQTIGARAQTLAEQKQAADKEERALKLAAVQRGEKQVDTEIAAEEARKLKKIGTKTKTVKPMKLVVGGREFFFDGSDSATYDTYAKRAADEGGQLFDVGTQPKPSDTKTDRVRIMIDGKETDVVDLNTESGRAALTKARSENPDKNVETVTISAAATPKEKKVGLYEIRDINTGDIIESGIDVYSSDGYEKITNLPPDQRATKVGEFKKGSTLAAKPIEVRNKDGAIVDRLDLSIPEDRLAYSNLSTDVTTHTIGTYTKDSKGSVWKEIRGQDGNLVSIVDTNTQEGADAVKNAADAGQGVFNIGTYSPTQEKLGTKLVVNTTDIQVGGQNISAGTPMYLTDKQIDDVKKASGAGALRNYEKADEPPDLFGSGDTGKALSYFSTATNDAGTKMTDLYASGADDPVMESQISIYTAPSINPKSGLLQKRQLPDFMKSAIKKRVLAGGNSPVPINTLGLSRAELEMVAPNQDVPLLNPDNTVNIDRATADPTFIITGLDYTQSQGFASTLNRTFNAVAGQLAELGLGTGYAGKQARITSKADKQLSALGRKTVELARAGREGRIFALDLELLQQEVNGFQPGGARSDVSALEQLRTVRSTLAMNYKRAKDIVDANAKNPADFADRVAQARLSMRDFEGLIAEYTAAILAYEANMTPGGAAANVSGGSATATSRRQNP
jgi:hypothetical protein